MHPRINSKWKNNIVQMWFIPQKDTPQTTNPRPPQQIQAHLRLQVYALRNKSTYTKQLPISYGISPPQKKARPPRNKSTPSAKKTRSQNDYQFWYGIMLGKMLSGVCLDVCLTRNSVSRSHLSTQTKLWSAQRAWFPHGAQSTPQLLR